MSIDGLSLGTTPVNLYKGDKWFSLGTGFFYMHKESDDVFCNLVTNYHVLTGHSPGENKKPKGDKIIFNLRLSETNPKMIRKITIPIFNKDGTPKWVTSSSHPDADVALIPLQKVIFNNHVLFPIGPAWAKARIKVRPTTPITLIGYPRGYFDTVNQLPIYKTGSIASEPDVDFEGKPCFLVDVSAFPGMSGSPVFAIAYGMYETEDGPATAGGVRKFLGIYASTKMIKQNKYLEEIPQKETKTGIRLSESMELGRVWKAHLIDEIAKSILK